MRPRPTYSVFAYRFNGRGVAEGVDCTDYGHALAVLADYEKQATCESAAIWENWDDMRMDGFDVEWTI